MSLLFESLSINEKILMLQLLEYQKNYPLKLEKQLFGENQTISTEQDIENEIQQIYATLATNDIEQIKLLSCKIQFKAFHLLLLNIINNINEKDIKNKIKICSDHNIFLHALKNKPELKDNFVPINESITENIENNQVSLNAFINFAPYYYSLYTQNKCALDLRTISLLVSSNDIKQKIIDYLKTIEINENDKITLFLYQSTKYFNNEYIYQQNSYKIVTSSIFKPTKQIEEFDTNAELYNIQLETDMPAKIAKNFAVAPKRFLRQKMYRIHINVGSIYESPDDISINYNDNENFYYSSIEKLYYNYILKFKIIEYLNIQKPSDVINTAIPRYNLKRNPTADPTENLNQISDIFNINKLPNGDNGRFVQQIKITPYERYYSYEYMIKHNLINKNILRSRLDQKYIELLNKIKEKGLNQ